MAKATINPDMEITLEDEIIENKAMRYLLGCLKENMEIQKQQDPERKES